MASFNLNAGYNGLGTFVIAGCPAADSYIIAGTLSLPRITKGNSANSQVVVTVKQNNTTVYTGLAGADGFQTIINAAANDIVSVILSSAATVDVNSKEIRLSLNMSEGGL